MTNPWLKIPLSDYEGHMALPDVGQSEMLANEFSTLLNAITPKSVALVGCAGGNGFDKVAGTGVERLVGIDINADYIADAKKRYSKKGPELELYCLDIQEKLPEIEPVELVYAALLFEYVDVLSALKNIHKLSRPGGVLAALLQLPKEGAEAVTPSPFTSLSQLSSLMQLIPPNDLNEYAAAEGYELLSQKTITLKSGKRFSLHIFSLKE